MKLSLITVCYNAEKTIARTAESVLRQADVDLEYIIVDGGSQDGTVREIENFARKTGEPEAKAAGDGRRTFAFKWISEKDGGMYDAINKGIRMATGDVIGILNADDWFDGDDALLRVCQGFADSAVDCVFGDVRFVTDGRTVRYYSARGWRPWMFQWGKMPPHPGVYIRRACFDRLGGYRPGYQIAADYELLIRFLRRNAIPAKYLDTCLVCMALGGKSTRSWRSNWVLNREIVRGNRENGYFCCLPMLAPKYVFKIFEFILPRLGIGRR